MWCFIKAWILEELAATNLICALTSAMDKPQPVRMCVSSAGLVTLDAHPQLHLQQQSVSNFMKDVLLSPSPGGLFT